MQRGATAIFTQLVVLVSLWLPATRAAPGNDDSTADQPMVAPADTSTAPADAVASQKTSHPADAGGASGDRAGRRATLRPPDQARIRMSRCGHASVQRPFLRRERACLASRPAAGDRGCGAQHARSGTGSGHAADRRTRIAPRRRRTGRPVREARAAAGHDRCADAQRVLGARGGASLATLAGCKGKASCCGLLTGAVRVRLGQSPRVAGPACVVTSCLRRSRSSSAPAVSAMPAHRSGLPRKAPLHRTQRWSHRRIRQINPCCTGSAMEAWH